MLNWIKPQNRQKPETIERVLAGYHVEITYKRVRNITLRLKAATSTLFVSAPRRVTQKEIAAFIQSRADWIARHQAAMRELSPPRDTLAPGDLCAVWGRPLTAQFTRKRRQAIHFDLAHIYFPVGDVAGVPITMLDKWYKREAEQAVARILPHWLTQTKTSIDKISCRSMSSRWGSCSPTRGTIRLNSALAQYDPQLLEYVLVHELTHLYERGHNQRFYGLMDQFMPNWRSRSRALNQCHPTAQPRFLDASSREIDR